MKNRLEDLLIISISHAIGAGWACIIIANQFLARAKFQLDLKKESKA